MKRKNRNSAGKTSPRSHKSWLRTLFAKKTAPLISMKRRREAKARAAANRRAFLCMAIGVAAASALFVMVLSVPPHISPEELAADVKAQRVPGIADAFAAEPAARASTAALSYAAKPHEAADALSPYNPAFAGDGEPNHAFVSFEKLSAFRFFVTDQMLDKSSDQSTASRHCLQQIPEEVKALNDKGVSLKGFMLPMKYEGKLTTEFLLLRNQSLCCYGKAPRITEWVNVQMAGKGVRPIMDKLVTVSGIFHVGAVRANGELVGIYRLDADNLKGPRE